MALIMDWLFLYGKPFFIPIVLFVYNIANRITRHLHKKPSLMTSQYQATQAPLFFRQFFRQRKNKMF